MLIAIDARWLAQGHGATYRATEDVLRALPILNEHRFVVFCYPGSKVLVPEGTNISVRMLPKGSGAFAFLRAVLFQWFDLVHYPVPDSVPWILSGKNLLGLPHLADWFYPDTDLDNMERQIHRKRLAHAVRNSDRIIVPSYSMLRDTIETFNVPESKFEIVEPPDRSVDERGTDSDSPYDFPYLLCVSSHREYKNLERLIEGFAAYKRDLLHPEHLVIVGKERNRYPAPRKMVIEHQLHECVHFVSADTDAELDRTYQHAKGVILPSLYEGFPRSIVESAAFGIPSAMSDLPCAKDVKKRWIACETFNPLAASSVEKAVRELAGKGAPRAKTKMVDFTARNIDDFAQALRDAYLATRKKS